MGHFVLLLALFVWPMARAAERLPARDRKTEQPIRGPAARKPVPEMEVRARAEQLVREVFQGELAKTQPADRLALARRMFDQALQTNDDPAACFVLLAHARDLSAGVPDGPLLMRILQRLDDSYAIDLAPMALTALAAANRAATTPKAASGVAQACLTAADLAVLRDDHDTAGRLCSIGQSAADRSHELPLVQRTTARAKELKLLAGEYHACAEARDTLAATPDDPVANLTVGGYECLVKGDWPRGLPLLARSGESPLRSAAQLDLSNPADASRQMELANALWELGNSSTGLKRRNLQLRAAHWYRQALPGLSGISQVAAAGRIASVDATMLRERGLAPGLTTELFRGIDFTERVKTRIDAVIDHDWGVEAADPALPKDNFSVRWTGSLQLPSPGEYELTVLANTGTRIWIDGAIVVDEPNLTRHRNGVKSTFQARSTIVSIRVDYWDTSGTARMRLLWRPPDALREEPIPPTAFWHEAASGE